MISKLYSFAEIRRAPLHLKLFEFNRQVRIFLSSILACLMLILVEPVFGVPSYARQTNMSCSACHTAYPRLTTFGRLFKLNGYTLTGIKTIESKGEKEKTNLKLLSFSPLSAMFQTSYTNLNSEIPGTQNNNIEFPQEMSLFLASAITPSIGTFIQLTYEGQSGIIELDNTDLRYARHGHIGKKDFVYGVTLNNSPTVEDVWNSTSVWGFPFAGSGVAPTPAAATLIDGGLSQQVVGVGAYGLFNNLIYANFTVYRSFQLGFLSPPDSTAEMIIKGVSPYWRVALQHQWKKDYAMIGTYGICSKLYPEGVSGDYDTYNDIAFDVQYEHTFNKSNFVLHSTWIHETQNLDATFAAEGSANMKNNLNTFKADASMIIPQGLAFTLGYFSVSGDQDNGIYMPESVDGSLSGKPNSDGWIAQIDYSPFINVQFSLQYTMYDKFNGGKTNYDGSGRNATDNNAAYLLVWVNF